MSFDAHANFALANVTVGPTPPTSGTSLTVDDASLFPATPFNATCWPATVLPTAASAEILRVTNIASNVLTITRAQEGSSAQAIAASYQIAASLTAKILTDIESAITVGGAGTDQYARNLAYTALQTAWTGTNTGTNAYNLALSAYGTASEALSIAKTGTNNDALFVTWFGTVHSIPAGGTTGQVLTKNSATNYDVSWTTVSTGTSTSSGTSTGTVIIDNYLPVMDMVQIQVFL